MATTNIASEEAQSKYLKNDIDAHKSHINMSSKIPETTVYSNARQYAQALRPWLWQYQNACVMQNVTNNFAMQMQAMAYLQGPLAYNFLSTNAHVRQRVDPYANRRAQNFQNGNPPQISVSQQAQQAQQPPHPEGTAFRIPSFWKRFVAELIDFTFLFYIKMAVSLCLMTELSLDQLSFLNSEDLLESFNDLDYDRAFAITFEVIALEILNRVLITIFETLCLYRAAAGGRAMGATPGKRLLGLKVVSCDQVYSLRPGQVIVAPAGQISFKNAFLRSVIKNFTIAFFLPACLTLFFFKHNRAVYDIIAHTIVVEDPPI
ncbi:unnamed protein product [Lymnaea stagnalis]|uniref:RDD domain-containing protein n=1 Tax=Lymnaea stagnalis TaxID=6523 RepID=A0AAV2IF87_LYMST